MRVALAYRRDIEAADEAEVVCPQASAAAPDTTSREANRALPDQQHSLDALVEDVIGASKFLRRGYRWGLPWPSSRSATPESLGWPADALRLDPVDPANALTAVIAEARAVCDLGCCRLVLLDQIDLTSAGLYRGSKVRSPGTHNHARRQMPWRARYRETGTAGSASRLNQSAVEGAGTRCAPGKASAETQSSDRRSAIA